MAFEVDVEMVHRVAKITLAGTIDARTAPQFKECIDDAADQNAWRVALLMQDVEYMGSAGVRVLIFARSKIGSQGEIYVIGAQELVRHVLEMTGLVDDVILLDRYDAALIEQA